VAGLSAYPGDDTLARRVVAREDGTMKRVHVVVGGTVQGVGYRYTMQLVAREAGVAGWVRNLRDGRVEAEVEGPPAQVDEVLAWMAEGPPGARVTAAEVSEVPASGATGFEVRSSE
jgi:acylphosphatase